MSELPFLRKQHASSHKCKDKCPIIFSVLKDLGNFSRICLLFPFLKQIVPSCLASVIAFLCCGQTLPVSLPLDLTLLF